MGVPEIIDEIQRSFAHRPMPPDGNIVYDDSGHHLECADTKEAFRGRRWQDLPTSLLRDRVSALAFMTPEAARYNLPPYLVATLRDPEGMGMITVELIELLTLPRAEDTQADIESLRAISLEDEAREIVSIALRDKASRLDSRTERFFELVRGFALDEARAIRASLEHMSQLREHPELAEAARRASDRYWKQFA